MAVEPKMLGDMVPLARALTEETFCQRHPHPFILGKEVVEEEFAFRTVVARESTLTAKTLEPPLRIRDWVLPIHKPGETPSAATRVFVGRAANNDLVIPHPTVSKLHAYFTKDQDKWWLVDVGSSNGTKMNGMRAPARARVSLHDGDTLLFGRCAFTFVSARRLFELMQRMAQAASPAAPPVQGSEAAPAASSSADDPAAGPPPPAGHKDPTQD